MMPPRPWRVDARARGDAAHERDARAKLKNRHKKQRQRKPAAVSAQAVDCLSLDHEANVSGCTYTGEDHSGEDLSSSRMVGTIFRDGTLIGTDLSSSAMKNAVFRNAKMCGADLRSSNVAGTNFRDADLTLGTGSRAENNRADAGGGIRYLGTVNLSPGAAVSGNTPDNCESAIGTCS